jgi:hypothetical protein
VDFRFCLENGQKTFLFELLSDTHLDTTLYMNICLPAVLYGVSDNARFV